MMADPLWGELPQIIERTAQMVVRLRHERRELLEQVHMLQSQVAGLEQARTADRARLEQLAKLEQERSAVQSRLRELLGRLEVAAHAD